MPQTERNNEFTLNTALFPTCFSIDTSLKIWSTNEHVASLKADFRVWKKVFCFRKQQFKKLCSQNNHTLFIWFALFTFPRLFQVNTCEPCVQVATPLLLWVVIYVNARCTRIRYVVRKPYISYARERSVLPPRSKLRSSYLRTMKFLMSLLV